MWELDCEEGWAPKNWCFWTVVLEKTLESPLDCKEIQQVHSEGDQPWDFFGRNDAKADTPELWPPHAKSWLIGKDSDAGRDWGQEEKGTTEDEMAGWNHWLDGCESQWTPEVGVGREAWRAAIRGVAKSRTQLSDWSDLIWSEATGVAALLVAYERRSLSKQKPRAVLHVDCFKQTVAVSQLSPPVYNLASPLAEWSWEKMTERQDHR